MTFAWPINLFSQIWEEHILISIIFFLVVNFMNTLNADCNNAPAIL